MTCTLGINPPREGSHSPVDNKNPKIFRQFDTDTEILMTQFPKLFQTYPPQVTEEEFVLCPERPETPRLDNDELKHNIVAMVQEEEIKPMQVKFDKKEHSESLLKSLEKLPKVSQMLGANVVDEHKDTLIQTSYGPVSKSSFYLLYFYINKFAMSVCLSVSLCVRPCFDLWS